MEADAPELLWWWCWAKAGETSAEIAMMERSFKQGSLCILVFGIQSIRFFQPNHHTSIVYNDLLDGDSHHYRGGNRRSEQFFAASDLRRAQSIDVMTSIESCRAHSTRWVLDHPVWNQRSLASSPENSWWPGCTGAACESRVESQPIYRYRENETEKSSGCRICGATFFPCIFGRIRKGSVDRSEPAGQRFRELPGAYGCLAVVCGAPGNKYIWLPGVVVAHCGIAADPPVGLDAGAVAAGRAVAAE